MAKITLNATISPRGSHEPLIYMDNVLLSKILKVCLNRNIFKIQDNHFGQRGTTKVMAVIIRFLNFESDCHFQKEALGLW